MIFAKRLTIIVVFVIAILAIYLLYKSAPQSISQLPQQAITEITQSDPFSQLFKELTIPYLRQRPYQSTLGELQQVSKNSAYTSYLTTYKSDGLTINGLLTQPTGTPPSGGWPAIVFVHGYIPPTLYKTQEKYVAYVDYLAKNGFVVFKIDLRGHGTSEGLPTGAYYSSGYVIDTLNAYAALQSTSFINPQAIGLWGHSMAGNIVLRSMVAKPEIPATVIWAGAGYSYDDLQKYRIHDQSYRPPTTPIASASSQSQEVRSMYPLGSEFWKQVAPIYFLNDLKGAIEIHHAENDDVVSIKYSEDLNTALNNTSVPHQFFKYPTGGHNISDPSFSTAMKRTVEFFKQHLKSGS